MTILITLASKDWTHQDMVECWKDEESLAVATAAADSEIAYLINNAGKVGQGWRFHAGKFEGEYRGGGHDPVDRAMRLHSEAVDYVL